MPKNVDRLLQKKWDEIEARKPLEPESHSASRLTFGRVRIVRPFPTSWSNCGWIKVLDKRTGAVILNFDYSCIDGDIPWHPYPLGWLCFAGAGRDQDALLLQWTDREFSDSFDGDRWMDALPMILKMVSCPSCEAWTGGGICFRCAGQATRELYENMERNDG